MASEQGLKALAEEFDRLESMGFICNKTVRMHDNKEVYIDYRGKFGKIYIDDLRYDLVQINLINPNVVILSTRQYYDIIEEKND